MDFIKIKNFSMVKDPIQRKKKITQNGKKFVSYLSDEELVSRKYKVLNNKKTTQLLS